MSCARLFITLLQQRFAAQISDNGRPSFAFNGIQSFQRGVSLLKL